jgi:hypothetical protein
MFLKKKHRILFLHFPHQLHTSLTPVVHSLHRSCIPVAYQLHTTHLLPTYHRHTTHTMCTSCMHQLHTKSLKVLLFYINFLKYGEHSFCKTELIWIQKKCVSSSPTIFGHSAFCKALSWETSILNMKGLVVNSQFCVLAIANTS